MSQLRNSSTPFIVFLFMLFAPINGFAQHGNQGQGSTARKQPTLPVPEDSKGVDYYWFKGELVEGKFNITESQSRLLEKLYEAVGTGSFEKTVEIGTELKSKLGTLDLNVGPYGGDNLISAAFQAPISKRLPVIKWLVEVGAVSPNIVGENGTPLQTAVRANDAAAVEYLLSKGADVNARSFHHATNIAVQAVATAKTEVVKALISKKIISSKVITSGVSTDTSWLSFGESTYLVRPIFPDKRQELVAGKIDVNDLISATKNGLEQEGARIDQDLKEKYNSDPNTQEFLKKGKSHVANHLKEMMQIQQIVDRLP